MTLLLHGLLIGGLILFNAFFAAAEYALLSVRRTRIEQLAREGSSSARLVQSLVADIGLLISGTQLGMTVISLLMGWLGESMMAAALESLLEEHLQNFASVVVAHSISVGMAFLFITILLMVLGELVPKALAYERAEQTALIVARPMLYFLQLSRPLVLVVDGLADIVLRGLGQSPGQFHGSQHTPEEAKLIVSAIRKRGMLGIEQEEMIHGVFDLHRMQVREVMVPRPRITCLQLTHDLNMLMERIVDDQHSRVPIYEGLPDHIIGILYTKDLLRAALDRLRMGTPLGAPFDLKSILHPPMIVPESMSLNQMLKDARRKHAQMALVVDEFGTFVGLVTIEDVLEQIVGEIQDEYDREEVAIQKIGADVFEVDASLNLRDFADDYQIHLPREAGYATMAGFVLAQLGLIPRGGESFVFEGRRYTVTEMEGRRVARIKVEKVPAKVAVSAAGEMAAKGPQGLPGKVVKS
jgi:magnesium and cobalt exporter, CNNM family